MARVNTLFEHPVDSITRRLNPACNIFLTSGAVVKIDMPPPANPTPAAPEPSPKRASHALHP